MGSPAVPSGSAFGSHVPVSRRIVVGLDGSPASKEALRWAVGQAKVVGAELLAVMAWRQPVSYGYLPDYSDADLEGDARKRLEQTVAEVLSADPAVPVTASVVDGHPAPVLIEAARGAELLVVGSHGHGAFVGMLLGSVSQHCVQHAPCPVVVVRPRPT